MILKRKFLRKIKKLLEILRFTPSSVNIQPWHFVVADNLAAKERIAKALTGKYAYNAPKVLESSHTLVFCTKRILDRVLKSTT